MLVRWRYLDVPGGPSGLIRKGEELVVVLGWVCGDGVCGVETCPVEACPIETWIYNYCVGLHTKKHNSAGHKTNS